MIELKCAVKTRASRHPEFGRRKGANYHFELRKRIFPNYFNVGVNLHKKILTPECCAMVTFDYKFGHRELSKDTVNTTAIFEFRRSGRLVRGRNLYQGGGVTVE